MGPSRATPSTKRRRNGAIEPALSNFIFELLMAYGSEGSLFWNIVVRDWFIAIQKGSYQAGDDFKLNDLIRMRGRSMWLI